MDVLSKLSREAQVILGGGVLLLILSFFDWQSYSIGIYSGGFNEWRGIGFLAGLLILALLGWEAARAFGVKLPDGQVSNGLVSVGLAMLVVLFTVIYFLTHGAARSWPAWGGLIVALVVGAAAVMRARAEGVQMPQMPQGSPAGSAGSAGPVAPAAPAEPAESAEPTEPTDGTSE